MHDEDSRDTPEGKSRLHPLRSLIVMAAPNPIQHGVSLFHAFTQSQKCKITPNQSRPRSFLCATMVESRPTSFELTKRSQKQGNTTVAANNAVSSQPRTEHDSGAAGRPPNQKKSKTQNELDEELRQKMEGIAGEGGASGVEYEDGRPVAMKRSVRENMFRYI